MPTMDRFTVSLDTELLAAFDRYIADRSYENRSEAVRDMIRDLLLSERLSGEVGRLCAFLTFVVDHRASDAFQRIRRVLQDERETVAGWMVVPLDADHDACAVAFQSSSQRIRAAAESIQALRGVSQGRLSAIPLNA